MKHIVIVAHPSAGSFTMALAGAYTRELEQLGHQQKTYDLYRMGFNPVMAAAELLPITADHPAEPDVMSAQNDLREADALTLIYPLWWMSMPAMMKGYIDRVFARGFAYESSEGKVRGLLGGKKAVLITLSGAPLAPLVESGRWNAVQVLQDVHILRATGFELREHLHFDEIAPNLPSVVAEGCLSRVRQCARGIFPGPSRAGSAPNMTQ
jgi:NAD(P)H dehydrogenase (quinone)